MLCGAERIRTFVAADLKEYSKAVCSYGYKSYR